MRTLGLRAALFLLAAAGLSGTAAAQGRIGESSAGERDPNAVRLNGGAVVSVAPVPINVAAPVVEPPPGVRPAPLTPAASPEALNRPASAVVAPERSADESRNGGGATARGPSRPSVGPAETDDGSESASQSGGEIFDARRVKIGPEITFEDARTRRSWGTRMALGPITNSGVVRTVGWMFGLRKTSARVDPQAPTKRGGEHASAVALEKAILKKCSGCVVAPHEGKFGLEEYRITFPNGYWVNIAVDPGAVEIQTPPLSGEEYRRLEGFIQANVYDRAAEIGLAPRTDSDGHLNIGALSAFPKVGQFAEFLLDQVNHPELGLGVLGEDLNNAPPLAVQDPKQLASFFKAMDKVKDGSVASHKELATVVNTFVYYKTRSFNERSTSGRHYQAVSVKRLERESFPINDAPVELRYNIGRRTFGQTLLAYDLILRRVAYLNRRSEFSNLQREPFVRAENMSPSEKISRFYIFVGEMGEDFSRYRELIANPSIAAATLDAFTRGEFDWTKERTMAEVVRYLPDLETSAWVRRRMHAALSDPQIPAPAREQLVRAIEERRSRSDIPVENKKVLDRWWGARAKADAP